VTGARRLTRLRAARAAEVRPLLVALAAEGVAPRSLALDGAGLEATFARDDLPDWERVKKVLSGACKECTLDETGAVTLVGAGVGSDPTLIGRALEALELAGAKIAACRATPLSLTAHVDAESVDAATRAVHSALLA
jgi:aspartokinase